MINVQSFGAKGDGSTDDTYAIQSAINSLNATNGGVIFFPSGVYNVSNTITIALPGVSLVGERNSGNT